VIPGVPHVTLALGLLSGTTLLDGRFADYRWNVDPRASFGISATASAGRFHAGVRAVESRTTQTIDVPDPGATSAVRATSVELTAGLRVARLAGFELAATASGGRLRLGWSPDHVDGTVGGTPISIDFAPVDAWIGGGGLAVAHRLPGAWRAGLAVDRCFFSMDTAHAKGGTIVTGPQTFGDWNARVELSWLFFGA